MNQENNYSEICKSLFTKKILITLIIFLFVCGCVQQQVEQQEKTDGPEVELGEGTLNVDEQGAPQENIFTISKGNHIMFNSKKVTIKDLNFDNELILDVDGKELVFFHTKQKEIFQGLIITPQEFHLDKISDDTYAVIKIEELKLEPNQYLVYYNQEISIPGKGKVILKDVFTDNMDGVFVKVITEKGTDYARIKKGETVELFELKITNIFPRPRPIGYEKYALMQVE